MVRPLLVILLVLAAAELPAETSHMTFTEELSHAYGYCLGQRASIEAIKRKYPDMATDATHAQAQFDLLFSSSCENLESELKRSLGQQWRSYKKRLDEQIQTMVAGPDLTRQRSSQFVGLVRQRAKGNIESPVLETLLSYDPVFQKHPEQEFTRRFTQTFRTRGHPKSMGLDFQIEVPKSWRGKEGKRPHVLQLFTSRNGHGVDAVTLLVLDLPNQNHRPYSNKDLDEFFSEKSIRQYVPDGATLVMSMPVVLDRQKGALLVYDQQMTRVDKTMMVRSASFITVYQNRMVFIQCMITTVPGTPQDLSARYAVMEPLFKLIANSFVLHTQY